MNMSILKEGIPRHTQITRWIEEQIRKGEYNPDDKLPSENELAEKFDVSRVTIRRALQSLESNGVIYRCQGLGSFVSDSRTPHNLIRLTDFNEDMARAGMKSSSEVHYFGVIPTPQWLADAMDNHECKHVVRIDRLRLGNGEPVAFDVTWLPLFYGQLIEQDALQDRTIYKILEDDYDIRIVRGTYQITADVADEDVARELQLQPGCPLLRIDRISYTIANKAVYYQKRYYRSDKVVYEMTLERDRNDKSGSGDMPLKEFVPVFK
jgi:GntR family transcriptional regulator